MLNPVRAGMVADESRWAWSSYRATVGLARPPKWLAAADVLRLFDENDKNAMPSYRQFVGEGVGRKSPWTDIRGQIYLGGEAFLEKIANLANSRELDNVPMVQRAPNRVDKKSVLEHVCEIYGIDGASLLSRENTAAYCCAAYLLRRAVNLPLCEVAELFGVSVSRIAHIQREWNPDDPVHWN